MIGKKANIHIKDDDGFYITKAVAESILILDKFVHNGRSFYLVLKDDGEAGRVAIDAIVKIVFL